MRPQTWVLGLLAIAALLAGCGDGGERNLILATTTSTENTGLLEVLVPRFEEAHGYHVRVIAVGTGAALAMGERGDADMLLVHAPEAEEAFMAAGYGSERARVMYNDFIIVGPPDDPAGIEGATDATAALAAIAEAGATFVSRGDDSGTHTMERALWEQAGGVPSGESWYGEAGQGMEATLTIAVERGSYTLTDRGTWLAVANREALPLLVEGDERLLNVYHVIVVNPDRHDHVDADGARRFLEFMIEPQTLAIIETYGVEEFGQPLFVPSPDGAVQGAR